MDSNNKRLVKNTAIMYVQVAINMIVGLLTARLLLQALGASDYGTYNVVGGLVAMMVILSNPMMTGAQRFFAYDLGKNDEKQLARDFNTTNLIYWILAFVVLFILETLGLWFVNNKMEFEYGRMEVVNWVYQFSIFSFFLNVIAIPYNALLIAHENIFASSLFEILQKIFQLIAVLFLWIIPYDSLVSYSAMMFVISAAMRIAPQLYCKYKYKETKLVFEFDKKYFRSILAYSGYNSIGVVAIVGMEQGINILLNLFFGPIINAAKGICTSASGIVQSLTSNIYTPARPQLTKYYALNDQVRMWRLVEVVTKVMFFISMLLVVPLFIEVNYILRLWLGNFPQYTASFIQLSLVANLISVNGTMLCGVLQAANKIRNQQLTAAVLNLFNLPLSYIALKIGLNPSVPFIIMIVMNLLSLYATIKVTGHDLKVKMSFFYFIIFRMFIALLLASIIPIIIYWLMDESFYRFLLIVITSTIFCIISTFFVGFNDNERIYSIELVRKYVHNMKCVK